MSRKNVILDNKLNEYFLSFDDKIIFLTIKNLKLNNNIYENLEVPIYSKHIINKENIEKFTKEVSIEYFLEGIILLNGINNNFNNIEKLNIFINDLNINYDNFLIKHIKNSIKFNDIIYNMLLIQGVSNISSISKEIGELYIKLQILLLDYIDNKYISILLNNIKSLLSIEFKKNPENSKIHILYGDLYLKEKLYTKSVISYKKALSFSQNEKEKLFLENSIKDLYIKSEIENIINYINKFNFEIVYKSLENIKKSGIIMDKEDLYWLGFIYNKLSVIDEAIIYYEKSLELNADYLNLFLELGICYYKQKEYQLALDVYNKGLKKYIDEENLMFNKILINLKLKNLEKVKEDIDKLLLYEDLNNQILNDILYLKSLYELDNK